MQRQQSGDPARPAASRRPAAPAQKRASRQAATESFQPAEKTSARIYRLRHNYGSGGEQGSGALIKTVQEALGEIEDVLSDVRSLTARASAKKLTPLERAAVQETIDGRIAEIDRIASEAEQRAARFTTFLQPPLR